MMKIVLGAFAALFCGAAMADPLSMLGVASSVIGATGLGSAATSLGLAGLGVMGLNKALNKKSSATTATQQTAMPTPDDEAVKRAKQRQVAEIQARSGRASTILSDGGKLGG